LAFKLGSGFFFLESFALARLILQLIVFGMFQSYQSKNQLSSTEVCSTIVSHLKHITNRSVFLFDEHQKTPRWDYSSLSLQPLPFTHLHPTSPFGRNCNSLFYPAYYFQTRCERKVRVQIYCEDLC